MEKYGIEHHTSKNCGQPSNPIHHHHYGHFFSPPSRSRPKPLRPLTSNTHGSRTVVVYCRIWPRLPTVPIDAANQPTVTPPNCLCAAHVPTAFPPVAVGTELPDDANRSVGQTYCIGIARDGPYTASRIVACNHIVVVDASCTVHIIVKLIVISIVFSSFNDVNLLHTMLADRCMPLCPGWWRLYPASVYFCKRETRSWVNKLSYNT
jgi:hypothetical protein